MRRDHVGSLSTVPTTGTFEISARWDARLCPAAAGQARWGADTPRWCLRVITAARSAAATASPPPSHRQRDIYYTSTHAA